MKKIALLFVLSSFIIASCNATPPTKEEQQKQYNDLNEKLYMEAVEKMKRFDTKFKDGTLVSENEDGKMTIEIRKDSNTLYTFSGKMLPKVGNEYNLQGRLFLENNQAIFYYYVPGAGMTKADYEISDKLDSITFTIISSDNEFTKPLKKYTFNKQ
jgi:hypothetical protein